MGKCQDKRRMREAIAKMRKEKEIQRLKDEKNAKIKSGEIIIK